MCARNPDLEFTYRTHADYIQHMDMVHNIRFDDATGRSLKADKPWLPPGSKANDEKKPL